MTVYDLIELTHELASRAEADESLLEKEVRFASQPNWPFEYSIEDNYGEPVETANAVYLAEGRQIGYLPGEVKEQLGW